MGAGSKLILKYWDKIVLPMDNKRMSAMEMLGDIVWLKDIPYSDDNDKDHLLDIMYPENTAAPLPVIMDIHGGGWTYGNKELNRFYCGALARLGFTVVDINYRLLQKAYWPAQLKDCAAAVDWILKNNGKFNMDSKNLFVTGDSAGGHLAAILMALAKDSATAGRMNISLAPDVFKAGGFVCGAFDVEKFFAMKNIVSKGFLELFFGKKYKEHEYRHLSSFGDFYKEKIAPVYLVSSEGDFIKKLTIRLDEKFSEAGQEHLTRLYLGKQYKHLKHVFNVLYPEWPESAEANREMCAYFRKFMVK